MAATYSSAPSTQAQNKAKADIKFTAELDEILKRITEIKNIAGVIVVNSEGITVKSTLENSLSVQVLLFSSTYFLKGCCTTASKYRPWNVKVYANIFASLRLKQILYFIILRISSLQYSVLISQLSERAKSIVRDLDPANELTYLRIKSRKHEILVAPEDDFILIVVQNPPEPLKGE